MKLAIIGASGHGKVVADIAEKNGYDEIEFFDDDESIELCGKWPVLGTVHEALNRGNDVFIAIGKAEIREKLMECFAGRHFPVLIHPNAVIADDVVIGDGSVVMAGTVINPGVRIGRGCIINTCSSVDHDCNIDDFVHISVGAHLSGTVNVGKGSWIAVGASIVNNVEICERTVIGAGAVVVKNIEQPGTYVGVPAKTMKKPNLIWGGYSLTHNDQLSERRAA